MRRQLCSISRNESEPSEDLRNSPRFCSTGTTWSTKSSNPWGYMAGMRLKPSTGGIEDTVAVGEEYRVEAPTLGGAREFLVVGCLGAAPP